METGKNTLGNSSCLDVGKVLKIVFADPDWMLKAGIGGIFCAASALVGLYSFACLPIMFAFWAVIVGYTLKVMRHKVANPDCLLPGWDDWVDLFVSGITWIAFQCGVWVLCILACLASLTLSFLVAFSAQSSLETIFWVSCGTFTSAFLCVTIGFLSSFVMVNFAVEENSRAGLAFIKAAKKVAQDPLQYFLGYLLVVGIQWAVLFVPVFTLIGVFVIPSTYFVGQIISASLLAKYWGSH